MKKNKYYVVWEGRERGIFEDWKICKKQVDNFSGAKYKSFEDKNSAENALKMGYNAFFAQNTAQKIQQNSTKKKIENHQVATLQHIPQNSIFVDAACSGNPGVMEYRGVDMQGNVIFYQKFEEGTNNIGEFLAIVHGLALLKKQELHDFTIFSDSKTALSWIRQKKAKTKLTENQANKNTFEFIQRAEIWLKNNAFANPLVKWDTENMGEIPADFGRK